MDFIQSRLRRETTTSPSFLPNRRRPRRYSYSYSITNNPLPPPSGGLHYGPPRPLSRPLAGPRPSSSRYSPLHSPGGQRARALRERYLDTARSLIQRERQQRLLANATEGDKNNNPYGRNSNAFWYYLNNYGPLWKSWNRHPGVDMVIREVANRYLPESLSYPAQLLASWEFNYRINPLIQRIGTTLSDNLDPSLAPILGPHLNRLRTPLERLTPEEVRRAEEYVNQVNERALRYRGSSEDRRASNILNAIQEAYIGRGSGGSGGGNGSVGELLRMLNSIRYSEVDGDGSGEGPSVMRELFRGILNEYFMDHPSPEGSSIGSSGSSSSNSNSIAGGGIGIDSGIVNHIDRLADII